MAFEPIFEFEKQLAEYTGAPYAIMTDCCTHAIELCMRYRKVKHTKFTAFTYLSVPMTMHKLGINYELISENWAGEYRFYGTDIWDSARRLQPNMYREGQAQCLSFGFDKPLSIGHSGAILLDDPDMYRTVINQRYDGRNLHCTPWQSQKVFQVGYHYKPSIEDAVEGIQLLEEYKNSSAEIKTVKYPDCRTIIIED